MMGCKSIPRERGTESERNLKKVEFDWSKTRLSAFLFDVIYIIHILCIPFKFYVDAAET